MKQLLASTPRIIWIELTSRCPLECTFCSRRTLRGDGAHMDFTLFERIVAELEDPEIIRLNYSGESIVYPQLARAVKIAKQTGAVVELVTALSPAPRGVVEALVEAGLDRLTVSLHTLNPGQYHAIYGADLLDHLERRMAELVAAKQRLGVTHPEIDFSFVAMAENLSQLDSVATYAQRIGSTAVYVHPVIRRDLIPASFLTELDPAGNLRSDFVSTIRDRVEQVRQNHPNLAIVVARPGVMDGESCPISTAGIPTCEQNPWETAHVLSNGDVVACEVHDKSVLGNLNDSSLRELWTGSMYSDFRERYLARTIPECNVCAWRRPVAEDRTAVSFLWGWHEQVNEDVRWGRRSSLLTVHASACKQLLIEGVLPPATGLGRNRLTVTQDGVPVAAFDNPGSEPVPIEIPVSLKLETTSIQLLTSFSYCPADAGTGTDRRHLGFGVIEVRTTESKLAPAVVRSASRSRARLWLRAVTAFDRVGLGVPVIRAPYVFEPGVSVIIPERGNANSLISCLDAVSAAIASVSEPVQIIVIVNGSDATAYEPVQRHFPGASFHFFREPLGFSRAIGAGLRYARYRWTYLLNSDMLLDAHAITRVLDVRAPNVFGIGSRIHIDDRSETNLTEFVLQDGLVDAVERKPSDNWEARQSAYSGGGCSLFQTAILRRLVHRTRSYDPFYWEDIEWGAVARRNGYINLFCPTSHAWHEGGATVGRYYGASEVDRIVERNRLLFNVRNAPDVANPRALRFHAESLPDETVSELIRPAVLWETIRARSEAIRAPRCASELFAATPQAHHQVPSRARR